MPNLNVAASQTAVHTNGHHEQHHDHGHEHKHQHDEQEHEHDHGEGWREWARVGFVALMLVLDWLHIVPRVKGVDILALVGVLIGGYPIFKEAISDLFERRMTMELSMTIARSLTITAKAGSSGRESALSP